MYIVLKIRITFFLILAITFISPVEIKGQLESSKWIFGYGAGIDFASGHPVSFSGSMIKTSEGTSSISNSNGNLLFYTDGISVWNKKNELMPNGKNLTGHISSTQSVVIVPKPGSNSIYYIFTLDSEADIHGFSHSIVDMSMEKGLGNVLLKNQLIKTRCTERIVAIKHQNNKDIWIIIHEYNSDAFLAYQLTNEGILPNPLISNIGIRHEKSKFNTIGYLKASMDSKKLAVAIFGDKIIQLFDFDDEKGILSKPQTIKLEGSSSPYGLEFSPNDFFLYVSIETNKLVYQINLNAGNEAALQKSLCLIGRSKNNLGALQLAIDGKIYIAEYKSQFLSVIENPNIQGTGCSFKANAISLDNNTCMFGLPTFYHDYVKTYDFNQKVSHFNKASKIDINKKYILNNVYFDFNQAAFRNSSATELRALAGYLKRNSKLKIEITGHTDSIGSMEYNDRLSVARANGIGLYLTNKGIELSRISCTGKGSSEPVALNSSEVGRQRNRRVEFSLHEF